MPYQTGSNIRVAFKQEPTVNTLPGASGATQMRLTASPGMELKRASVQSSERRSDMLTTMGRLGSKMADGSYNSELSLASYDPLLAALFRTTFSPALVGTGADFTSITTTTNTIVAAAGSFITKGYRVGDVVQLNTTGGPVANNRNLRLTGVSASTLTVAETITADATARTTFTITRGKKLTNPALVTRASFTIEEYYQDILASEVYTGCRVVGLKLSAKPDSLVTAQWTFMGMDRQIMTGGASPYFTSPTLASGLGLVVNDSTIRYNGSDVAYFTGFDLDFSIAAKTEPVMGSAVSPDVFDNDLRVSGTITALRSDLTTLTTFDAETEFEMQLALTENMSEPKNYASIFLPRSKFSGASKQLAGDGALPTTLPVMIGPRASATGYDAGVATFVTSAP